MNMIDFQEHFSNIPHKTLRQNNVWLATLKNTRTSLIVTPKSIQPLVSVLHVRVLRFQVVEKHTAWMNSMEFQKHFPHIYGNNPEREPGKLKNTYTSLIVNPKSGAMMQRAHRDVHDDAQRQKIFITFFCVSNGDGISDRGMPVFYLDEKYNDLKSISHDLSTMKPQTLRPEIFNKHSFTFCGATTVHQGGQREKRYKGQDNGGAFLLAVHEVVPEDHDEEKEEFLGDWIAGAEFYRQPQTVFAFAEGGNDDLLLQRAGAKSKCRFLLDVFQGFRNGRVPC